MAVHPPHANTTTYTHSQVQQAGPPPSTKGCSATVALQCDIMLQRYIMSSLTLMMLNHRSWSSIMLATVRGLSHTTEQSQPFSCSSSPASPAALTAASVPAAAPASCATASALTAYALLLCLGANVKPGGAGPSNISLMHTQSAADSDASKVSNSLRPLYAGGRHCINCGVTSSKPTGMYLQHHHQQQQPGGTTQCQQVKGGATQCQQVDCIPLPCPVLCKPLLILSFVILAFSTQ